MIAKQKQEFALLLSILFCIVILVSSIFIATRVEHQCDGEICTVCVEIQKCENLIKSLSSGVLIVVAVFCGLIFKRVHLFFSFFIFHLFSLVTLKVKLTI